MCRVRALLLVLFFSGLVWGQVTDNVQVVHDVRSLQSQMRVRAVDGQLVLSDVFRAISRYHGYDDSELARIFHTPMDLGRR